MKLLGIKRNVGLSCGVTLMLCLSGILQAGVTVPTPEVRQSAWQCRAELSQDWRCQRHSRGAFEFTLEQVARATDAPPTNSRNPMDWPQDAYTVQLVAVSDPKSLQLLREKDTRLLRATEVVIQTETSPLYLLLLGHYPTRDAAEAAIDRLAIDKTTGLKPWIRPLNNLQKRAPKLVNGQS